jgi:hypothetical protein
MLSKCLMLSIYFLLFKQLLIHTYLSMQSNLSLILSLIFIITIQTFVFLPIFPTSSQLLILFIVLSCLLRNECTMHLSLINLLAFHDLPFVFSLTQYNALTQSLIMLYWFLVYSIMSSFCTRFLLLSFQFLS